MIIQEEWVHDAVEHLRQASQGAAEAQGNLTRAEYKVKQTRARLILEAPHTSMGMREAWADCHPDFEEICNKLAQARQAVEWYRNERSKCETICEMWRTQSATIRTMGMAA